MTEQLIKQVIQPEIAEYPEVKDEM